MPRNTAVVLGRPTSPRDVPPFSIVAGVPARLLKIFNPATKTWEGAATPEAKDRILTVRAKRALPTREEYRFILHRTSKVERLSPLLVVADVAV